MSNNSFGVVDKEYTGRRVTQQGPIAANQPIKLPIYISDKQQVMVHINNGTGSRLLTVNEYEYSAGATSNLYLPTINVSASETVHVMFLGAVPYDQAFLLTAFAQTLLDDADATTALATLGAVSRAELQNQSYISATTAGTVPTYTASITPTPTLAAGLRVRVKFHASSTAAGTLNLNGLGAYPIKQMDAAGARVDAVFFAGQLVDLEFDGTIWIVISDNPSAIVTAAKDSAYTNSSKSPASTDWVKGFSALNSPKVARNSAVGNGAALTTSCSFNAPCAGILVAIGVTNYANTTAGGNPSTLFINGTVVSSDNTTMTRVQIGFATISAARACTCDLNGAAGTAFSLQVMMFFLPTV